MSKVIDFVILGAGIVGLTIARELKHRNPQAAITVLEKEATPGQHASGRNSGVLHSGIYYPPDSLKAKVCRQGALEMAEYHETHQLRLDCKGKILVTTTEQDAPQLELLAERAKHNGVQTEFLDATSLKELEPEVRSATNTALWVPSTKVGSPADLMKTMIGEITSLGIEIRCGTQLESIQPEKRIIQCKQGKNIHYGHAINATGLQADSVAHLFGVGERYTPVSYTHLTLPTICSV